MTVDPPDRRIGVHVALSPVERDGLAALAVRLGVSRSEVVRRGVALMEQKFPPRPC